MAASEPPDAKTSAPRDEARLPQDPVRVVLCTSGGLHGAGVLARLGADPRVQVAGVVLSSRVLGARGNRLGDVLTLYRHSGLRYLLYLWAATGLADRLMRDSVTATARSSAIPLHVTRDINDAPGRAFVDSCQPHLLVSAFFNQRISPEVIELARAGAVNIHPSLLPELKGVDPVFFARLRGISPLGVTLHRLAPELDAGPVLAQAEVAATAEDSILEVTAQLFERGAELLLDRLGAILAGDPGSLQTGIGSYDSWPSSAHVEQFRRAGGALVRAADLRRMWRKRSGRPCTTCHRTPKS